MASGTSPVSPSQSSPSVPASAEVVEYGRYIETQLQRTRAQVKWVEIASGMMTLLAAVLGYTMLVAVLDAWVVSSGLNTQARWLCLIGLLAGGLGLFIWKVVPAVLRPINPVFAAYTIEQSRPSLKNGLINFLLLRSRQGQLAPVIYQAVEQRAATDLSQIEVDATVDRSRIIKLGYVLIGLLAFAAVYKLVSPKDPFRSIGRMVFPWAKIIPPSRVTLEEITPGDAEVFHGDYLEVAAIVRGVDADEQVTLYYTTDDGQIVDRPVTLTRPTDGYRHVGSFPPDTDGFKQAVEYYLRAGDARSPTYRVTVKAAPAITVKTVDLEYPRYTGLAKTTQERGDIQAIEGTIVTVRAKANQPISSAYLDFGCDGTRDLVMAVAGDTATAAFLLQPFVEADKPQPGSYLIRFTNPRGHENPQPIRHSIEVVRDLPPEITFQAPDEAEVELPRNGAVAVGVKAHDVDFALSRVALQFELGDKPLHTEKLLAESHSGEFRGQFVFDAAAHALKPGDEVLYYAEAEDNKSPAANVVRTLRRRIRIVEPVADEKRREQLDQAKENCRCMKDGDGKPGENGDGQAAGRDGDADDSDDKQPREDAEPKKGEPKDEQQGDEAENENSSDENEQDGESSQGKNQKSGKKSSRDGQGEDSQAEEQQPGQPDDNEGEGGSADETKDKKDQQPGGAQPKDPQKDDGAAGKEKQPGGVSDKKQPAGKQGNKNQDRVDPETESGDAIEEINKHRDQQSKPQQPQPGAGQPDKQQQPGQQDKKQPQPKPGEKGNDKKQPGGQQGGAAGEQEPGQEGTEPGDSAAQENAEGNAEDSAGDQPAGAGQKKQSGERTGNATSPDNAGEEQDADGAGEEGATDSAKPGQQDGAGGKRQENGEDMTDGELDGSAEEKAPAGDKPAKKPGQTKSKPQDDEPTEGDSGSEEEGQGDQAEGTKPGDKQPAKDKQDPSAKGGNPDKEQGDAGAGQKSNNSDGSPPSEGKKTPTQKKPKGPMAESDQEKPGDAQAPTDSGKESDSQGQETGDKVGGGKQGGGQQANKPGTGGPGQNTPSDEGASEGEGEGNGRTSQNAGRDVEADRPTGESSEQKAGEGSQQRAGGKQPGGAQQPASPQAQPGQQQSGAKPPMDSPATSGGAGDANSQSKNPANQPGDGQQGSVRPNQKDADRPAGAPEGPGAEQADDPNLEFARQKTDLALEYLKDQLENGEPDQELLDKLGWTREDMQRFLARWEEMKRKAGERGDDGKAARKRLDEELRGLGLRPQGTKLDRDSLQKESEHTRLRDSRRSDPPPEYAEQYKAYTQGKAKGRKAGK